ncbi:MAG TPA: DUF5677 domain-containing protein [Bacteriovoracaceae bacterium]|nr:DUF5677 domain-containing protein [Bacteriovoracaceae bacterium]
MNRFAKITNLNISLSELQLALKDKVQPEECEHYYNIWEELQKNGDQLLVRLEKHITSLPKELSKAFPSVVAATEAWFDPSYNEHNNPHYKAISPIVVALYDLLLSLKRAYEHKSAITCGIITRSLFEAKVNLAEISRNPEQLVPQFTRFRDVAKFWNEYKNGSLKKEDIIQQLQSYPQWYDNDWKVLKKKGENWTGVASDNIRQIATRNNLEDEYKSIYKITSAFVHISPLLSNYYSVQGNGPLCNEQGVFEMGFIGLGQFIEAFGSAQQIIGLDSSVTYGSLNIPLTIFSHRNF